MRRTCFAAAVVLCLVMAANHGIHAQSAANWERLRILLGTWESSGDTQLGEALGTTSFTQELNGHVIVRRSFAEYKSGPQAGTRHDDLLVIYRDPANGPPKAVYFDSEGHVIRYAIATPTEQSVVFQSESADPGPRYRLSYARVDNALNGTFEVAMPGADYKTYLTWTSSKR